MAKLKVSGYGMTLHMNHGAGKHTYLYQGYVDQPGHVLHGKLIQRGVHSERGKPTENNWSVDDGTEKPQRFNSLLLLMDHYKLKPMQE